MNQESQANSSVPVHNLSEKRKRGRPRLDNNLLRRARRADVETARPDPVKRSTRKDKNPSSSGDDTFVGQTVSGVVEGSFDAGYVIKVRIGETNTFLRGVVFYPRRVQPITEANDVAPNLKMVKRNETVIALPILVQGSAHAVEQTRELPDKCLQPPSLNAIPLSEAAHLPPEFDLNHTPVDSALDFLATVAIRELTVERNPFEGNRNSVPR